MDGTNTGSFGSAIGGLSPELQAAVARRGGGATMQPPALSQTSNTAPTADPALSLPQPQMLGGTGMPQLSTPMSPQEPSQGSDEAQLIIKALDARLRSDSKIKEAQIPKV